MIVDPLRHLFDLIAVGGILGFAYLLARFVSRISDAKQRPGGTVEGAGAAEPGPGNALANDNGPAQAPAGTRLAA
jgi:hypothetical protein